MTIRRHGSIKPDRHHKHHIGYFVYRHDLVVSLTFSSPFGFSTEVSVFYDVVTLTFSSPFGFYGKVSVLYDVVNLTFSSPFGVDSKVGVFDDGSDGIGQVKAWGQTLQDCAIDLCTGLQVKGKDL